MQEINILYQFNDFYATYAGVSMFSLLENIKKNTYVNFYILDDGISTNQKNRFKNFEAHYYCSIRYIETKPIIDKLTSMEVSTWRGNYVCYLKFFAISYIEQDIDRLIYIDADTIICDDISDMCKIDLQKKICAMALEGITCQYKQFIGLKNYDNYNAGVIIFDCDLWKKNNVEAIYINFLNKHGNYIHPEQDSISVLLKGKIYRLPPSYNYLSQHIYYSTPKYFKRMKRNQECNDFYSLDELDRDKIKVKICHYIDLFTGRPWETNNINPFNELYDTYWKKSFWKDTLKINPKYNVKGKTERLLRKILPFSASNYFYFLCHKVYYTVYAKKYYHHLGESEE